eukprot:RCo042494
MPVSAVSEPHGVPQGGGEGGGGVYSNLLIRFPKVWETFLDVRWEKELFDGLVMESVEMVVTAENFVVSKTFAKEQTTFRLQGLTPGTTYKVAMRALHGGVGRS